MKTVFKSLGMREIKAQYNKYKSTYYPTFYDYETHKEIPAETPEHYAEYVQQWKHQYEENKPTMDNISVVGCIGHGYLVHRLTVFGRIIPVDDSNEIVEFYHVYDTCGSSKRNVKNPSQLFLNGTRDLTTHVNCMKCAKVLNLPIRADKYVKNPDTKPRVKKEKKPEMPLEEKQKLVDRAIELQIKTFEMRGYPLTSERIEQEKRYLQREKPYYINSKIKDYEKYIFNRTNVPINISVKKQELIDEIVNIWKIAQGKAIKSSIAYPMNIEMEKLALMNSTPKELEMTLGFARQLLM
jgi:hypothetical protein